MKTTTATTLFRREFWENRNSFIVAPAIVSALIILLVIGGSWFAGSFINKNGMAFTISHIEISEPTKVAPDQVDKSVKNFNAITSVMDDPNTFDDVVMAVMYANCALLYLVFAIVLASYALRCLFDDRKNKDILFWRSMPVSETANVLVKLGMIVFAAPAVMLALNILITLLAIIIGLIFFGYYDIQISMLLSSLIHGQSLYIPFQIFYELVFCLVVSLPIIGFTLFVSALAKKSPFLMLASPAILILADALSKGYLGISLGLIDLLSIYAGFLVKTKAAFVLQESFLFDVSMIIPVITCVGIGAVFIAGAIWLRNNRYEI